MTWLRQRGRLVPYLLLLPGLLWLLVFFAYPLVEVFLASFWSGSVERGYVFSLSNWTNYPEAIGPVLPQVGRSLVYAFTATLLTFLIAYPLAYTIAVRGGRAKSLLLFLVVAPFFTSFLLRTLSWKILLGDDGVVLGPLKDIGLLPDEFRVLATPMAVVAGITYNFLPFMTLPIYVALEKVDFRLVEAARDLYAGPWRGGLVVGAIVAGALAAALALAFGWSIPLVAGSAALVGAVVGRLFVSEAFVRVTFATGVGKVNHLQWQIERRRNELDQLMVYPGERRAQHLMAADDLVERAFECRDVEWAIHHK